MLLEVNFRDKNDVDLGNMFGTDDLPEGTQSIKVDGRQGMEPAAFERLAKMINRSSTRIGGVSLKNIVTISPEFLAVLIAITKKADNLTLWGSAFLGDPGFACLMTCMMQPNGIKFLSILHYGTVNIITMPQASMLFEGIANSTSLERLTLFEVQFGPHYDDAGRAFIHALRRNRSLKYLNLCMNPFAEPLMIANILRAAILETKVESIKMYNQRHSPGTVPFHIFKDLIYRENCSLDTLHLVGVSVSMFDSKLLPPIKVKNSSLKNLLLDGSNLNSSVAAYIAEGCKSLTYLDVSNNQISDLAPFDKLLLGDDAKLEMLIIDSNPISNEDFLVFLKKLPRMKSLGGLFMKDLSILKSKACRDALLEALWRNTSLERVCCYDDRNANENEDDEDVDLFRTLLPVPICLNRGGRRQLQNVPTNSLPRGVWARVLHRAMTLKYHTDSEYSGGPVNTALRLDVVYWLLRKKFLV